jgi:hypothetical protein
MTTIHSVQYDGGKVKSDSIPEEARLKEADFMNNLRTGSITYRFKEGKPVSWDSREIGRLR